MDKKEIEKKARQQMCVLLALETLTICILFCRDLIDSSSGTSFYLSRIYFHYNSSDSIFLNMAFFCGIPTVITLASLRFKWIYLIYEALHCIPAIFVELLCLGGIIEHNFAAVGFYLLIILALCHRFIIYNYKIR